MKLIDQHTKGIMEGCKQRARDAGLVFQDETLEYIVTNRDLLELASKDMIPTLYDYWVHDVECLREKGRYEIYPYNPYETVINTHPPISFYNDNNPDWLNVMIFYHVLAHIDFFQNNHLFSHTWNEDFAGQALADKRLIAMLRSQKGRWVDYVIEFTRGIDNTVNYYSELSSLNRPDQTRTSRKLDYYFDIFLQSIEKVTIKDYLDEISRYNNLLAKHSEMTESLFISSIAGTYPEFNALYAQHTTGENGTPKDLIRYIMKNSVFLNKKENQWMTVVMEIVRKTSLYFQPQIRTKIMNEGWASSWHEKLTMEDDRIKGHEISFARLNARVTALPRAGINPYGLGMRLLSYARELANKGKFSHEFDKIKSIEKRRCYDRNTSTGQEFIFTLRENFSDFMLINTFVDQDFVDMYRLFVVERRLDETMGMWKYFVKSRKAEDYRQMLHNSLYHPPHITINESKMTNNELYLDHQFEEKPLVQDYIANTLLGIEFLWGAPIHLETTELIETIDNSTAAANIFASLYTIEPMEKMTPRHRLCRVVYTMKDKKLSRTILKE